MPFPSPLGENGYMYMCSWVPLLSTWNYNAKKDPSSQSCGFSSSHVWMWELDHKQSCALKNWCFRTVVLEKTLESPLGCKEIQPVNPKGDQSWIVTGRTDADTDPPILWPPDAKSGLLRKDPDAGKDWRQQEKGKTEDEMVGWHHQLNGHEFEQAPGVGDGQGSLAWCSKWGCKESDTTEQLNWTELKTIIGYTPTWVPRWHRGKESTCQSKRSGLDPSVGKIPGRRKWQPTPVFLPGKSHGQRSLVDCSPWGRKASDMT